MNPFELAMAPVTRHDLAEAMQRLARASVLVVGDAMLDRYIHGRVERISPEAPVPVLGIEREVVQPGGAANVVRNLTALGAAAAFISVVGDDQTGSELTGLIGGQPGVEPWLLVQGGRTTTCKTRFLAHGRHLLRADREQTIPIEARLAERLVRIAGDAMAATSASVLSDYGKGVLAGDTAAALVAAARGMGRPVLVDPSNADCARFAGADLILPTARELAMATGLPAETDGEIERAAGKFANSHGFGAVMVLRGEIGISLMAPGLARHWRLPEDERQDLFGVTDAVLATLAAACASGLPLEQAGELAALAAEIVAGHPGTAVARTSDFLARIDAIPPEPATLPEPETLPQFAVSSAIAQLPKLVESPKS